MRRHIVHGLLVCSILIGLAHADAGQSPSLTVWAVDPLIKVFRDAVPQAGTEALAEVARGEHASLQVVALCPLNLQQLRAEATPLRHANKADAQLTPRAPRFVGYVPIIEGTPEPSADRVRVPPGLFPDPLLEEESVDVAAGQAQPIWVTVTVPVDATPGRYEGRLQITATAAGQPVTASFPLSVQVYNVVVERSRLWNTNWFWFECMTRYLEIQPEEYSEEWWALLRRYARNIAEHRQNMILISPLERSRFYIDEQGRLAVDFSRFDKIVELFIEEGVIGLIEGGFLALRKGPWTGPFEMITYKIENGEVVSGKAAPGTPEADEFCGWFLPKLVAHLREKGWLNIYFQHIADEPLDHNAKSFRETIAYVKKYAPELRTGDATQAKDTTGLDVWIPMLDWLHKHYAFYRKQQREAGIELWYYTCGVLHGDYSGRFLEQPLLTPRLAYWICFRYELTGYLHWGYNFWMDTHHPYRDLTWSLGSGIFVPAGDAWIVYPGKDGPIDSIRWEAVRDGIVDHELLAQLAERDPETAMNLAKKHILDFNRYDTDVATFRATRDEILERLSRIVATGGS